MAGAVTSFAGPFINGRGFGIQSLVANSVLGGVAAVAGGGKFANGAVTAAFGYHFNIQAGPSGTRIDSPCGGGGGLPASEFPGTVEDLTGGNLSPIPTGRDKCAVRTACEFARVVLGKGRGSTFPLMDPSRQKLFASHRGPSVSVR